MRRSRRSSASRSTRSPATAVSSQSAERALRSWAIPEQQVQLYEHHRPLLLPGQGRRVLLRHGAREADRVPDLGDLRTFANRGVHDRQAQRHRLLRGDERGSDRRWGGLEVFVLKLADEWRKCVEVAADVAHRHPVGFTHRCSMTSSAICRMSCRRVVQGGHGRSRHPDARQQRAEEGVIQRKHVAWLSICVACVAGEEGLRTVSPTRSGRHPDDLLRRD
jgi:hypothetical protein